MSQQYPDDLRIQWPAVPKGSPIRVVVPAFVIAGLFLAWLYQGASPNGKQTIVFCASVLGGAFALYSYLWNVEQSRSELAHQLIQRWNDPTLEAQKEILREVIHHNTNPAQYAVTAQGPPTGAAWTKRSQIVAMLSFCEEVALAVNSGSANEELVDCRRVTLSIRRSSHWYAL